MKIIDLKIYPIKLALLLGDNDLKIAKDRFICNHDDFNLDNNCDGIVYYNIQLKKNNNSVVALWLKNYDIPVLAHEATHAANRIFEYIGESEPSKEAYAYLVEYIVREFISYKDKQGVNVSDPEQK